MGCSASKLDDGEAIQLCKDRKNFIKQAVEQRLRFATGHTAYVDSLRRVSVALRNYMEGGGGEHHDLYSDSCSTPPFTPPVKRYSPEIIRIPPKPSSPKPIQYRTHQTTVHYLRSGGGNSASASVTIEETPVRVVNSSSYYYPTASTTEHYFGMQSSSSASPPPQNYYHPPPPSSPQNSQWDFFWNPFSSLENYGYHHSVGVIGHGDQMTGDDDMAGLRRVREEEGIPDLEDEYEEEERQQWRQQQEQQQQQWRQQQEQQQQQQWRQPQEQQQQQQWQQQQQEQKQQQQWRQCQQQQQSQLNHHYQSRPAKVEDETTKSTRYPAGPNMNNTEAQMKKFQTHATEIVEPPKTKRDFEIDLRRDKENVRNTNGDHREAAAVEETSSTSTTTPGFTVYINRRPGSMSEVMRDIETQFVRICDSSQEISMMLEASRAHYASTTSNELTAIRMLNPVALFRTASSRSASSRFLVVSSCSKDSKDENYETGSEFSEDSSSSCMLSGSHHSTLDRLYAWEKKLYEEVKSGERIRIAYEKKCMQLRSQDVIGEDPCSVDKTRKAVRDLHTRIKVSIHSIEAISRRIEKLRDEELHPQLLELIQGLSRMWRTMADCHRIQKRAIDEAKLLLATLKLSGPPPPLIKLAHFASNLEVELRNWRSCLATWITAHRSYIRALAGWLLRCSLQPDPSIVRPVRPSSPLSPPRSNGAPPIFDICIQWSRLLDSVSEAQAVDGLDFFAAGIASVVGQQREHALAMKRAAAAGKEEFEEDDDGVVTSAEKIAEVAVKVVCAGMSVAVSLLSEFAFCSMEGCEEVVGRCENGGKEETRGGEEERV